MKQRYTKKELENISDINFAIAILSQQISKYGVLLSYKRQKLNKTIITLQKMKDKIKDVDPGLYNEAGV